MPRPNPGRAAFTLTEVMIAVMLMLLSLAFLLSGFVGFKRSIALAQTHLTAMQLAGNEAERILADAYTNIAAASATFTNAAIEYRMSNAVVTFTNRKDITIIVQWSPAASASGQTLSNYISRCNPD